MNNRLEELVHGIPKELERALQENPELITEQDEHSKATLLHYAATLGRVMGNANVGEVLAVLFKAPGLDFTITDCNDNTPLHQAALNCDDRVTVEYTFPALVREAEKRGFDFSTLGQQGQSVLHIATRTSRTDPRGLLPRVNNVHNVLIGTADPGLNVLSASGSTAFYYAVNFCHFSEANELLDAGADPSLGSDERKPLDMLESHLCDFREILSHAAEDSEDYKKAQSLVDELTRLKGRMLAIANGEEQVQRRRSGFFPSDRPERIEAHSESPKPPR